jgi:hypothetical protein
MLATAGQLPTDAQGWVAEAKLDGCRSMARVYGEGASQHPFSRSPTGVNPPVGERR